MTEPHACLGLFNGDLKRMKNGWAVLALSIGIAGCESDAPVAVDVNDAPSLTILDPADWVNATYWTAEDNRHTMLNEKGTAFTGLMAAGVSGGIVIDFEALASTGGSFTFLNTYSEDGFTLVNATTPADPIAFASPHTDNAGWFVSSTALFTNTVNGIAVLTKDGGGTFDATSIDLAEIPVFGTAPRTVPFTGPGPTDPR